MKNPNVERSGNLPDRIKVCIVSFEIIKKRKGSFAWGLSDILFLLQKFYNLNKDCSSFLKDNRVALKNISKFTARLGVFG